jgi:hypothetical protein
VQPRWFRLNFVRHAAPNWSPCALATNVDRCPSPLHPEMEIVGQSEVPAFAQITDTRFHLEPDPGHASLPCRAGAGVLGGPR